MALFVGACDDELNIGENNTNATPTTIVPGGDIFFGASAKKKSAEKKDKRTVYGDPFDSDNNNQKDKIELNWVANDRVQIASPQSGGVANGVAEYSVATVKNSKEGDRSSTATLQLESKAGLQWNDVTPGAQYNFYAVYPSVEQLSKSIPASEKEKCKLAADGKLTGYLPNTQTVTLDTEKSEGYNYVFKPNMDYAYMVAAEEYFIPQLNSNGEPLTEDQDVTIDLHFSSMVTALKFTINAGEISIGADNAVGGKTTEIIVTDLTLFSASGEELCGAFECDFSNDDFHINNAHSGFNQVTMNLGNEGCKLSNNKGSITTTFFMLPVNPSYTKGDLKLIIHYYVNDVPQTMTATLGVDIPICEMTYINKLTMKSLKTEVIGSAWFSALHPNIYVSQVSIPVAGNVFANSVYGAPTNNYQQNATLSDLWNMGVRGFEIVTQSAASVGGSLKDCQVLAAEEFCTGSGAYTFNKAFTELVGKLKETPKETLIILASYMAKNDGYNPYAYVSNLFNYLNECIAENSSLGLKYEDFALLGPNTTVGDIQGKIVIVVRPGDDERWGYEKKTKKGGFLNLGDVDNPASPYSTNNLGLTSYPNNGLTNKIADKLSGNKWYSKVMCVWDWGTSSYDVWDRRYGSNYSRAATFNDLAISNNITGIKAKDQIEKYLYASNKTYTAVDTDIESFVHSSDTKDNYFNNYGTDPTTMPTAGKFNFEHDLSTGGKAYVQEWMRVIPEGGVGECVASAGNRSSNYRSLWVKWPSSIGEKKTAIKTLFEKSVLAKGDSTVNKLFINVLSGYYADNSINVSIYPFKQTYSAANGDLTLSNMGKGGKFQELAYDLNTYVYNLLSTTPGTEGGLSQDGPWGLVVMDHIGNPTGNNTDYSKALVNLIMMNNFRFPLIQKTK